MATKNLDLTKGNLKSLLLKLALPIMLSNFMQTLYNLTDAFWLGKLGDSAKAAVSVVGMAFPLVFFISSFGFGFVVAGTALVSQFAGAGDLRNARKVVGQFAWIIAGFSIVFLSAGFFFLDSILHLLNTPPEIFVMAKEYISIVLVGMFFMITFLSYQSFAHGIGNTISPMKIQIFSVLINVILDPFLIFGWSIFPDLGTKGAAYATLISRFIAFVLAIYYMKNKTEDLIPHKDDFKINKALMKKIFSISIPASFAQSMTSFGFLIMQGFVNQFGTVVISVYSIGNRMTSFYMMPAMGISNALASVVGQNLGAGNIKRAEKSVWSAMTLVLIIMGIGGSLMFLFGADLVRFFINDPDVIEAGRRMMRVTSVASFIFGAMFVFMGAFNGSGYTQASMTFNIARLWLFRIPMVYLLSGQLLKYSFVNGTNLIPLLTKIAQPLAMYPYDALWWSMVFSNVMASSWAYLIFRKGKWKKQKI